MKVVAFNGSPRKEGNTYHAIKAVAVELEKEGIARDLVRMIQQARKDVVATDDELGPF